LYDEEFDERCWDGWSELNEKEQEVEDNWRYDVDWM
jgi:hypothetical protein